MNKLTYYTHSGRIHADEALGFVITKMAGVCDKFIRLESLDNIPNDGLVADIGRIHVPSTLMFDHHQGAILRKNGYPYASAGLLWDEYGIKAIQGILHSSKNITKIWNKVDEDFIQGIDAHDADNAYSLKAICSAGDVKVMSLSNVISMMNMEDKNDHAMQYDVFRSICSLLEPILITHILNASNHFEAKEEFNKYTTYDGKLAILNDNLQWYGVVPEGVLYVIEPSNHPGSKFSMTAVAKKEGSRDVKMLIGRSPDFKEFIHEGNG